MTGRNTRTMSHNQVLVGFLRSKNTIRMAKRILIRKKFLIIKERTSVNSFITVTSGNYSRCPKKNPFSQDFVGIMDFPLLRTTSI